MSLTSTDRPLARLRWARPAAVAVFALAAGFLLWVRYVEGRPERRGPLQLEFEAWPSAAAEGMLFADGHRMVRFDLPAATNFAPYAVVIPEGREPLSVLRLYPLQSPGEMRVRNIRITRDGQIVAHVSSNHVASLNTRSPILPDGEGWRLRCTSGWDQAALLLRGLFPLPTPATGGPLFGRLSLSACLFTAGSLVLLLIAALVRAAARLGPPVWCSVLGTFLTVLGLRLLTILHYGDRVPHWDSWSLLWSTFIPYQQGTLTWEGMLAPVNEHRIFFSRLWSLGLVLINGQWENLYEASANALLHSATAAGLVLLLGRAFGRQAVSLLALLVAGIMGLPFSWENTVWANQSQFYFLTGFSLLTLWLLGLHRPFTARWWLGGAAALAAPLAMGAGVLAPLAVAALAVWRFLRDRASRMDALATFSVALVLARAAALLMDRAPVSTAGMASRSLEQFATTLGKTLAWPFPDHPWLALWMWCPLALAALRALARRAPWSSAEAWTVGLGVWTLAQAIVLAWLRGAYLQGPASRYLDLVALGVLANVLALRLWSPPGAARGPAFFRAAWLVICVVGILSATNFELTHGAASRVARQERSTRNLREFMRGDDLATLLAKRELELPHPNPLALAAWLRCEQVRAILPLALRDPVPLSIAAADGFTSPGLPDGYIFDLHDTSWGSYTSEADMQQGTLASAPLPALRYAYLAFPTLGPGPDPRLGLALRVRETGGGRPRSAEPALAKEGEWRFACVRSPRTAAVVEAADQNARQWFAFRAPREVSALSYASLRLLGASPLVLAAGLLALGFGWRAGRAAVAP